MWPLCRMIGFASSQILLTSTFFIWVTATVSADDRAAGIAASKNAGYLIGQDLFVRANASRCARVFPDRAEKFTELRDKVYEANKTVVRMAKEKTLAIADIYEGKTKRNEYEAQFDQFLFKLLQEETKNQTQAELERLCQGLIASKASDYF
jgi:hypothetical protein